PDTVVVNASSPSGEIRDASWAPSGLTTSPDVGPDVAQSSVNVQLRTLRSRKMSWMSSMPRWTRGKDRKGRPNEPEDEQHQNLLEDVDMFDGRPHRVAVQERLRCRALDSSLRLAP
ncbi:unnamed protein product, partial [Durusdinium trenchii]